jgi:FkbM family methyltransferase
MSSPGMFARITNAMRFRTKRTAERWWLWPTPNWRLRGYADLVIGETSFKFFDPELRYSHEIRRGDYEPGVADAFRRVVTPGDTVLDIGAHMGLYTVLSAKLTGAGGAVWAFEPDPVSREILGRNVDLNQLSNVTIMPVAISSGSGQVSLTAGRFGRSGSTIGHGPTPNPGLRTLEVSTTSLDAFVAEHGLSPDVAKVDVEGAEGLVLAGGTEAFARMRAVILELHPEKLELSFRTHPSAVLARIRDLGFRIWTADQLREIDSQQTFHTTTRLLLLRPPLVP